MIAASHAHNVKTVELLLAAGADVLAQDERGLSVLWNSALTGDREIVQVLIKAGADVNTVAGGGLTGPAPWGPITTAAYLNDVAMMRMLLDQGAKGPALGTGLVFAAMNGSATAIETLLAAGADVNAKVTLGFMPGTPLTAAAYSDYQNTDTMRLLLQNGADPTARDARDRAALD